MKLASRIRAVRRHVGLTQQALAEALQIKRSAVANWESASETRPTASNIHKLAQFCNVSFEWLATGRGEMQLLGHMHDIPAAQDLLVLEDEREMRLILAYRRAPPQLKLILLELSELDVARASRR